jgi:hypothetical protein
LAAAETPPQFAVFIPLQSSERVYVLLETVIHQLDEHSPINLSQRAPIKALNFLSVNSTFGNTTVLVNPTTLLNLHDQFLKLSLTHLHKAGWLMPSSGRSQQNLQHQCKQIKRAYKPNF